MKIRFQADADFKQAILRGVLRREPGMDFQTASVAGLSGLTDLEVLAIAAQDSRVIVSHDQRTMPHYFSEFIATQTSPGLIIIPQKILIAVAVEELLLIWVASSPDEWINRVCRLPL